MKEAEEIWKILREVANGQQKLKESQDRTDAQLAKTDAMLAKTIRKIDGLAELYGNVNHSNGEYTETYFYDSLADKKMLGGIKYDTISRNFTKRRNRVQDEYDILLENGSSVSVVETKYKVQLDHVDKL